MQAGSQLRSICTPDIWPFARLSDTHTCADPPGAAVAGLRVIIDASSRAAHNRIADTRSAQSTRLRAAMWRRVLITNLPRRGALTQRFTGAAPIRVAAREAFATAVDNCWRDPSNNRLVSFFASRTQPRALRRMQSQALHRCAHRTPRSW